MPHSGLAELAARCAEVDEDSDALLTLWRHCSRADLSDLRPFYAARLDAARANDVTFSEEARYWSEVELISAVDDMTPAAMPGSEPPEAGAAATTTAAQPEYDDTPV